MSNQNLSPTVSVLMSVYNEPLDWIQQAIDSILAQTFTDFEFIIINDKPDRAELKEFLERNSAIDARIRIHTNPENIGLTKSLNVGLKLCTGKYIARMDADDISLPERFQKQVELLENDIRIGIVGCWLKDIGSKKAVRKIPVDNMDIKLRWMIRPPFDHPSTMMRSSVLKDNGISYNERLKYAQDMQLWYEMGKVCSFANIPQVLFLHRHNFQQVSLLHQQEQLINTKLVRKKLLEDWIYELDIEDQLPDTVSIQYIINVASKFKQNSSKCRDKKIMLLYMLYLSLKRYNLKSFFLYIKLILIKKSCLTFRDHARVLVKHIAPNKYLHSGI